MISAMRDCVQSPLQSPFLWLLTRPTKAERRLLALSGGVALAAEAKREVRAAMKIAGSFLTRNTNELTDDDDADDSSVVVTNANNPFLVMAATPAPVQRPSPAARDASASARPSGLDLESCNLIWSTQKKSRGETAGGEAGELAATGESNDGVSASPGSLPPIPSSYLD